MRRQVVRSALLPDSSRPCPACGGPTCVFLLTVRCDDPACRWQAEGPFQRRDPAPAPAAAAGWWPVCGWCGCWLSSCRAAFRTEFCGRCSLAGPPPCRSGEHRGRTERRAWAR